MSEWTPVETDAGTWAVNWARVRKIINWYHKSELILSTARKVEEPTSVLDVSSWIGKSLYSLEVDWKKVRDTAETNTEMELDAVQGGGRLYATPDDALMRWFVAELARKARISRENKIKFQKLNQEIQKENLRNIGVNVARWQNAIDAARFTRDRSVDVLIIGATILTGGGAAAGGAAAARAYAIRAGTSGVLKSAVKFQDTGSFGAAGVTLGAEVVVNLLPIKVDSKIVRTAVSVGVRSVGEGATVLLSGEDFLANLDKAAKAAGSKAMDETLKALLENTVFRGWLKTKAVEVPARLPALGSQVAIGKEFAGRAGAKAAVVGRKMLSSSATAAMRREDERAAERQRDMLNRFTLFLGNLRDAALLGLAVIPPEGYTDQQVKMMLKIAG
ncbi:MAG: hypothetical protein R3B81_02995 [bacterium]